jgi:hypothetical protein
MAVGTAFRAFFAALFDRDVSERIRLVLEKGPESSVPAIAPPTAAAVKVDVPKPVSAEIRSDAVTLLATLQREARFVDLVKEDLSRYSDAQIGIAARPCLQQCATTLDRLLGLRPIETSADGQTIQVPENALPSRYQWVGEGAGSTGKLLHHGWEASQVQLPQWTGANADAKVVAPVQVKRI